MESDCETDEELQDYKRSSSGALIENAEGMIDNQLVMTRATQSMREITV